MDRTRKIIKYLEEYKRLLYLNACAARNPYLEEEARIKGKCLDKLIKELEEHGCRRTVDGK